MNSPGEHAPLAIGLDIGGTKVEGSLITSQGKVLHTLRQHSPAENTAMVEMIAKMVAQLTQDHPIAGVGCSIPGSLDPKSGLLRNAPNSPAINGTPFGQQLRDRLPFPIVFENDANCLVLSEVTFGVAKGRRNVVGLIFGTGVGGGVLLDGRLLHGSRGLAPEPGHLPLEWNGRHCLCGNLGCVEAYLSGPSLCKRYREITGSRKVCHAREIFKSAADPAAHAVLAETRLLYARFLAALVSLYDPEVFVLGGGLSLQDFFYEQASLISRFTFGTREVPPILRAAAGDASGKLGAAALVLWARGVLS